MSKQPCVWVVEAKRDGLWWCVPGSNNQLLDLVALKAVEMTDKFPTEQFRVAKYVRVEPKPKKGRK